MIDMIYKVFLKEYYNSLKKNIYINELADERTVERKAKRIMTIIIIKSIVFSAAYFFFAKGSFSILTIFIAAISFKMSVIKYFKKK